MNVFRMDNDRIVIRRGTHRDETVAFYLAPKVVQYIQEQGYPCILETKPLSATMWGEMLHGTKERFSFRERGGIYFTFHNTDIEVLPFTYPFYIESVVTCDGRPHFYVEIAAVYRDITNPSVLERVEQWTNGSSQRPGYADSYMHRVADVPASIQKGFITINDNLNFPVAWIAHEILMYAGFVEPREWEVKKYRPKNAAIKSQPQQPPQPS